MRFTDIEFGYNADIILIVFFIQATKYQHIEVKQIKSKIKLFLLLLLLLTSSIHFSVHMCIKFSSPVSLAHLVCSKPIFIYWYTFTFVRYINIHQAHTHTHTLCERQCKKRKSNRRKTQTWNKFRRLSANKSCK